MSKCQEKTNANCYREGKEVKDEEEERGKREMEKEEGSRVAVVIIQMTRNNS